MKRNEAYGRLMAIGAALTSTLILSACGGGADKTGSSVFGDQYTKNDSDGSGSATPPSTSAAGPSSQFAQSCAPENLHADALASRSSISTEKQWLRAYFDEAYLWREEVPSINANDAAFSGSDIYLSMNNYFQSLKTTATSPTGAQRDKFSFTMPTKEWDKLINSGVEGGYGLDWAIGSRTAPRLIRISMVEAGSAAQLAGVQRGDLLLSVDGVSADTNEQAGIDTLNEGLFPSQLGKLHRFEFQRVDGSSYSANLIPADVTKQPVPLAQVLPTTDGAKVGYLLFTDHIATAEQPLIDAVNNFKQQGVSDLVLDVRYNGGGYIYLASELAYMIAGPQATQGQVFEQFTYNSRRSAETNSASARTGFYDQSCFLVGQQCSNSAPLPSLDLKRIFVLTQSGTCSASEAIINGLRGVGVEVIQIGGTTCGKPYGFTAKDNCGISYLPIEFKGVNAKGFGDYSDGFAPSTVDSAAAQVKGCAVPDDYKHALGQTQEGQLSAALSYRLTGQCPALSFGQSQLLKAQSSRSTIDGIGLKVREKSPARSNRIALPTDRRMPAPT